MSLQPKHLKSFWSKKNILFVSLALIFVIGIGATVAWLTGYDGDITYSFGGAEVPCQVVNSYNNAAVQNIGNVNAHIRVRVIVHYRKKILDANGNITGYGALFPQPPLWGTDYAIDYNLTDWVQGSDGYYYHKTPVAPGATTPQLVTGFHLYTNAPEGYELRVEYLAEAIQSDPNGQPATEAWKAYVDENNHITGADEFTWD